jgi:hypothetical protein
MTNTTPTDYTAKDGRAFTGAQAEHMRQLDAAQESTRQIVQGYPKHFAPELVRHINWDTFGAARLELRCSMEVTERPDGGVTVTLFWLNA